MFKPNDYCYVKTSSGYVLCKIIRKQGNYYIVRTGKSAFGASGHRLISIEEYKKKHATPLEPKYYRPPWFH